jgi:GT2 family glycosyltransferase
MPKIGLVTVLFNSDNVLEGFFKSLSAQTFKDYHLYLVDNTPNATTDAIIKRLGEQLPVSDSTHIRNPNNVGVAKGNNQGIALSIASGSTHTLLLNNDIEFDQRNMLSDIYQYSVAHHESIIVPKIYFYDSRKIWLAGGRFSPMKGIAHHIGIGEDDGPAYDTPEYFNYSPTCFMLLDNKVFQSIGLMDEQYFVYYDDTDFVYRATQKGFKIYYMPSLKVLHKVSSSTGGGESLFSIYYSTRNRIFFIRKNFSGMNKVIALSYTLITRGIRWFIFDSKRKSEMVRAIQEGFKMQIAPK